MRQFTKEELDVLKAYEENFHHAVYSNFFRNMPTLKLNKIKEIYNEASGEKYSANFSCSHCILKFLQTVGKKYFADLEEYNNKAEEFIEVLDEVFEEVPDEKPVEKPKPAPKKKSTSKKKTTKK